MIRSLIALILVCALASLGQSPNVVSVDTLTQLYSLTPARGRVAAVSGIASIGDWGDGITLLYRYLPDATSPTNDYCIAALGGGRWVSSEPASGGGGGGGTATNAQPVYATIADAVADVGLLSGSTVRVLNYSITVQWDDGRDFLVTNALPSWGTNSGNTFATASGLVLLAKDARGSTLRMDHWGLNGDGVADNGPLLTEVVRWTATNAVRVLWPKGIYNTSVAPRWTGNYPIDIEAVGGGFATGWNPTNAVTETRIVYVGPATNIFWYLKPGSGFLYGINIKGVTVDANGLAETAIHIFDATRADVKQVRPRNATGRNMVLERCYYLNVDNPSPSANEIPFTAIADIGIALTNQCNGNAINAPSVSGASEWAVDVSDRSVCNTITAGAFESNTGGSIRIRATAKHNRFVGNWSENNSGPWYIQVDADALFNYISGQYFENRTGKVYIDGSYNVISLSAFERVEFGPTGGHNRAEDVALGIGTTLEGYWWNQIIDNVIDATATIRTNSRPDSLAIRGPVVDLIVDTNSYPMARLSRSSILFGDGTTAMPSVGWSYASSVSMRTPSTLIFDRTGAHDGIFSASVTGDSVARLTLNIDGTLSAGAGGTNALDTFLSRWQAGYWVSDATFAVRRPSTNYTAFASYMVGSAYPSWSVGVDGGQKWGLGGTNPPDAGIIRSGVGELTVTNGLTVTGQLKGLSTITLPTRPSGDNNTNAATTEYVDRAVNSTTNFPAVTISNLTVSTTFTIPHAAYGSGWNGQNYGADRDAVYDQLHLGDTDDDGKADVLDLSSAGYVRTTSGGVISTGSTSANLASDISDETGSGLLVFATSPTISGATLAGQTLLQTLPVSPTSSTNIVVDFGYPVLTYSVTNNVKLYQSTNRPSATTNAAFTLIRFTGDTSDRTLSWNSNWKVIGTNIATIPSNKVVIVSAMVIGSAESGVTIGIGKEE